MDRTQMARLLIFLYRRRMFDSLEGGLSSSGRVKTARSAGSPDACGFVPVHSRERRLGNAVRACWRSLCGAIAFTWIQ
jgi:hypothetical protein